jgi:toxin ParE1/3/4
VKVYVRAAAREDILRQYRYYLIEEDVASVALRFLESAEEAIEAITRTPDMGSPKLLDNPLLRGLRSWPVPGFSAVRIYYLHAKDQVLILRVLHGKRDVNSLLEDESETPGE